MEKYNLLRAAGYKNEEFFYSLFCVGIVITLIFWPLANSILCVLFAAYWLFFGTKNFRYPANRKYWMLLFCSLYLVIVIGAFHSANISEAIFKLQQKSAYVLFPVVIGTSAIINHKIYARTFRAFVLSTLGACIYCFFTGLIQYFKIGDQSNLYGYQLIEPLKSMTPFVMSICCLLALLFLCDRFYQLKTKIGNAANAVSNILPEGIAIAFLFSFLLLLGNRNILIAAALLVLYYSFMLLKNFFSKVVAVVCLFVLFAIAISFNPFLNKQWNELFDFSETNSIQLDKDVSLGRSWGGWQLRNAIWKCSWDVVKSNPFFGVGTGDVKESLQMAYENRKFYFASRYNKYNTHNQFLQEWVANGLMGLIVFLSCLILPLFARITKEDKIFYRLFLFLFAFGCLTDTPLELNKGIVLYAFFNAVIFFKSYNFKYKIVDGTTVPKF